MAIYTLLSSLLAIAVAAASTPALYAAEIEGSRLKLLPGEIRDPVQSNHFVTVISCKNGSVQVFYRDPDDGHKLLKKDVASGRSLEITSWDFHHSSHRQVVRAPGGKAHLHVLQSSLPGQPARKSTVKPLAKAKLAPVSTAGNYLSKVNTPFGPCVWKHFPIRVFLPSAHVSYIGRMQADIRDGFATWSQASHGKITFQFVNSPGEADMVLAWTTSMRNLKNQSESGEANVDFGSAGTEKCTLRNPGDIHHAKITFVVVDKNMRAWRAGELRPVAIHEIGHALGLMGHSQNPGDIMYYLKNDVSKPSTRDVRTLNLLYESISPEN